MIVVHQENIVITVEGQLRVGDCARMNKGYLQKNKSVVAQLSFSSARILHSGLRCSTRSVELGRDRPSSKLLGHGRVDHTELVVERGAEDWVAGRICAQASGETRQDLAMHSPPHFKRL